MGSKLRRLRHAVKHVALDRYNLDITKLERVADEMSEQGWTMVGLALTCHDHAILMFSKPEV